MPSELKSILITTSVDHNLVVVPGVWTTVERVPAQPTAHLLDAAVSCETPLRVGGTAVVVQD